MNLHCCVHFSCLCLDDIRFNIVNNNKLMFFFFSLEGNPFILTFRVLSLSSRDNHYYC